MHLLPNLLIVALLVQTIHHTHGSDDLCDIGEYTTAAKAHLNHQPRLAGFTRSTSKPHSFTLLTPDARVYSEAPPGWQGPVLSAAVVTPALGAHFSMYLVEISGDAQLPQPVTFPSAPDQLERFLYVLSGTVDVKFQATPTVLNAGGFCYFAPGDDGYSVTSSTASLVQIDRVYAGRGGVVSVIGNERDVETENVPGEVFRLKRLLNASDPGIDFNIHIMDFSPGEYLNVKEVHYNQHGLLMLQGHGIYRLDDTFLPVGTGDVIYLAPFVPQWYAALGSTPTRYFLYKDVNVDPLHT